jgi:hypothetical protein
MFKYLKFVALYFIFNNSLAVIAQSDFSFGLEITPSVKFQTIRNKATGLFTAISGYGFNIGIPVKYDLGDYKTISTGILYEFTAFDSRINSTLITSLRLSDVNVPIVFNYPITENYYANFGGGVNYTFTSKQYGAGVWANMNPIIRQFQPYISAGGSLLKYTNSNSYEIGANARYHLLNLWSLNTLTSTNIVSIDLNMKYFF